MVGTTYHSTARQDGGKLRCDACDCTFPPASLKKHQRGKQHLRNIVANGYHGPGTSRLSSPSHSTSPNPQSAPPQAASPQWAADPSILAVDPCVTVSHEDGLDFVVEG